MLPHLFYIMNTDELLLWAKGITKRFGGVVALSDVDFSVGYGEVVGLVGDNGAGKSTLVKIISGALRPDAGTIYFQGKPVYLDSPATARRLGIETVYQDLALVEQMSVAENIFLGRELTSRLAGIRFVQRERMRREATHYLKRLGIKIESTKAEVRRLSGGERQSVAIARAIFSNPKLVMMDEPTAALAVREAEMVLELISNLRERGISVILISHTLPHVFAVADRIVVLRHGKKVFDVPASETDINEVVKHIVGG